VTAARSIWRLASDAVSSYVDDYALSMGAALAYYTMFSLAPMLLIVIAVAGLVFGEQAAQGAVVEELRALMGPEGAQATEALLQGFSRPAEGIAGTLIGVAVLLIGATTVFAELQSALDRIWRAPARKKTSGLWALLRARLLSFGLILALGFLIIVSLLLNAALAALGQVWGPMLEGWDRLVKAIDFALSFGMITVGFALIYKFMPRVHIGWRDVWVGAIVTALLFTLGKSLIGLYIGTAGLGTAFGAAGSLVIVLVWVYYSAQIFLLGAEFTWVYAHEYGSRRGQPRPRPEQDDPQVETPQRSPPAAPSERWSARRGHD